MRATIIAVCFYMMAGFTLRAQTTPFERSNGQQTATYAETIAFYKQLDAKSSKVLVREMGATDAGYPLHLVLVSSDGKFDPAAWHKKHKAVLLINNGIHPGEPDGIDACMMLVRDIANGKYILPANVCLGIIPVYNIGGALNRGSTSRANQDGPEQYGFRGNSQNLDLNRDFTKNDSREARTFARIFHFLDPDIFSDNHVSDGADYQHTMTLLTTQYDKLGGGLGQFLKSEFEPALYKTMSAKGWDMCPYVNFETADVHAGFEAFYDPPRYSSGYAALWQTMAFVPETHMLKPFKQRTLSTLELMRTLISTASVKCNTLKTVRRQAKAAVLSQQNFTLSWKVDSTQHGEVMFKGYEAARKTSEVTGQQRLFYDHTKPFTRSIKYYNVFAPVNQVQKPQYYVIPQGWHAVTDLLVLNHVVMRTLTHDTTITVQAYKIDDYKSGPRPYEKHHRNTGVAVHKETQALHFLKGDHIVALNQPANRFLVEMLEPTGEDSYFAWNFFDAVLQQKEGYSDYRWEDVAAELLRQNPALKTELEGKKQADTAFAKNASAQLNWVYKHSAWYEPGHNRYPVYRIE